VLYSLCKLGLFREPEAANEALKNKTYAEPDKGVRVLKLLIAHDKVGHTNFESLTIKEIREFIRIRLKTYSKIKYGDRLFFPSTLLQNMVDEIFHG